MPTTHKTNTVPTSKPQTILRNLSDPKQHKLAMNALKIREQIVNDMATIESRDGSAMSARMTMLLHCIDLVQAKGLNLRVEALGTLTTEMLTAKDGWCQTSFAPALGLSWKTLGQSRKGILREAAKVLHYVVKSKIATEVKGKRVNENSELWCNMEYATETMKKAAKNAPIYPFSFAEIARAASSTLSEDGEEQASAIETLATRLTKALDGKNWDDVPAKAWNELSVVVGRISSLIRERDKARADTPAGRKRAAVAKAKEENKPEPTAYDSKEDTSKPLSERKAS